MSTQPLLGTIVVHSSCKSTIFTSHISHRIIGSEFPQELIGVFPYPTVTLNMFGVERVLEYTVSLRAYK